jgi:L-lysine exporter family protein LysE/ArgO
MWMPVMQGFMLGASLIVPIGAQNAYVLSRGIRRQHHLLVASLCLFCDLILILIGVFGGGRWLGSTPWLQAGLTWGGVAFLLVYGGRSLRQAWRGGMRSLQAEAGPEGRLAIILTTLAVTLLNPHVYLDTVMILGSVAAQLVHGDQPAFAVGAVLASTLWFYGLALLAARLSPWLARSAVQRGIDAGIGILMWGIAGSLAWSAMR